MHHKELTPAVAFIRRAPRLALILWGLIACSAPVLAREEVSLDGDWRFALQPRGRGFEAAAFDDKGWATVSVPHTWNAIDGADGGPAYVRGDGWYRRHFSSDSQWAGQRVFVDFRAANRVAEVWVNGVRAGGHRGGYSRFRFDITGLLKSGDNVLAVRVNNEGNGIIPLGGDFTLWGGLTRSVSLIVVGPTHFALDDLGSLGVYLTPGQVVDGRSDVRVRALVGGDPAKGEIRAVVRDAAGLTVAEHLQPFQTASAGDQEVVQTVAVPNPHLWQGRSDPYLYCLTVELLQEGRVIDSVSQPLGFRTMAIDPQRGLMLNGRHVPAHGVNRHEDWLDHGMALSAEQRRVDFGFLEDLGATVVRMCHYEHDEEDYRLCDTDGILAWTEVSFVGGAPGTPDGVENAVQQLRELIRQNYNHPSIFCWSVGNETDEGADPLVKRLAEVVREEDPGRFSAYASDHRDDDPRNFRTDLLGYNRYFGWYTGSYDDFGPWLDAWHSRFPERPLGLSEYGAGASIFEHEQSPPARTRTQAKGPWHPEEWQAELHERAWLTLKNRPYIWGTFVWCLFDFGSAGRNEGDASGRNDKGLVTYDRRTKKDAYFWYKANWTDTPFVYITSRRDDVRFTDRTSVKVYSNCDAVELRINGASLGTRHSDDHRFIWNDVGLAPGPNRLYAVGTSASGRVSDSCGWTVVTGTPFRPARDAGAKE